MTSNNIIDKKESKKKCKKEKKKAEKILRVDRDNNDNEDSVPKKKKAKKEKKKEDKKKRKHNKSDDNNNADNKKHKKLKHDSASADITKIQKVPTTTTSIHSNYWNRPMNCSYTYIVAPMVGASELPFRILCRNYGAQLAYTPMLSSQAFGNNEQYQTTEFTTHPTMDQPLTCHFAANNPQEFAKAAKIAQDKYHCQAIDLNLGCPQRTAYVGHFGSYLLDPKDRPLILDIIKTGVQAVSIPVTVKIRLLDDYPDTLQLCQELIRAGASLIAIHARYRATFHRNGPGARDGPAKLDQVLQLRQDLPQHIPIVTNGNTITYDDVANNLEYTKAQGLMSAEGILDNPALFLPRLGPNNGNENDNDSDDMSKMIKIVQVSSQYTTTTTTNNVAALKDKNNTTDELLSIEKQKLKILKRLRKIEKIELKQQKNNGTELNQDKLTKLSKKAKLQADLKELETSIISNNDSNEQQQQQQQQQAVAWAQVPLKELYNRANDKVGLALEYISLVKVFPTTMRTVIFHVRRMIKDQLIQYQLLETLLNSQTVEQVEKILQKIKLYQYDPTQFTFDAQKAKKEKDALERKKLEEGKRKAYEDRMRRKAKREGLKDFDYYLRQGITVPTSQSIKVLKSLKSKQEQLEYWKTNNHAQHCLAFHLENGNCPRNRSCAFLHVDATTETTFHELDEVAG